MNVPGTPTKKKTWNTQRVVAHLSHAQPAPYNTRIHDCVYYYDTAAITNATDYRTREQHQKQRRRKKEQAKRRAYRCHHCYDYRTREQHQKQQRGKKEEHAKRSPQVKPYKTLIILLYGYRTRSLIYVAFDHTTLQCFHTGNTSASTQTSLFFRGPLGPPCAKTTPTNNQKSRTNANARTRRPDRLSVAQYRCDQKKKTQPRSCNHVLGEKTTRN